MTFAMACVLLAVTGFYGPPSREALEVVVETLARCYAVDPELAKRVVTLECPSWNPQEEGDGGAAVGLWQWHLPSWQLVRQHMGASPEDLRADPLESTHTAMYAWTVMDLHHWWATYDMAREDLDRHD